MGDRRDSASPVGLRRTEGKGPASLGDSTVPRPLSSDRLPFDGAPPEVRFPCTAFISASITDPGPTPNFSIPEILVASVTFTSVTTSPFSLSWTSTSCLDLTDDE